MATNEGGESGESQHRFFAASIENPKQKKVILESKMFTHQRSPGWT